MTAGRVFLRRVLERRPSPRAVVARHWPVVVAFVVAVAVRLPGVFHGLPFVRHPDEPVNYSIVQRMVGGHHLLPDFYTYPSLLYDLLAAVHGMVAVVGRVGGWWSVADLGLHPASRNGTTLVLHSGAWVVLRLTVVTITASGVGIAAWLATRLSGRRAAGLVAGLLAAVGGVALPSGFVLTPDGLAGTTAMAAIAVICVLADETDAARRRRLVPWVAVTVALAVSAKFNNAVLVAPALFALYRVHCAARPSRRDLLTLVGVGAAVFVVCNPALVLVPGDYVEGIRGVATHYRGGHPGYEGDALWAHLRFLRRGEAVAALLALGALPLLRRRSVQVLVGWVVLYVGVISLSYVYFERNLTPVTGSLAVLGGLGAMHLFQLVRRACSSGAAMAFRVPVLLVVALVTGVGAVQGVRRVDAVADMVRTQLHDDPEVAARWVSDTVPDGASVVAEQYVPWLDEARWSVTWVPFVARDDGPETALAEGVDVVLVTSTASGRFLADPSRYPDEVDAVEVIRDAACRTERYSEPGYWVEALFLQCTSTSP